MANVAGDVQVHQCKSQALPAENIMEVCPAQWLVKRIHRGLGFKGEGVRSDDLGQNHRGPDSQHKP